MRNAPLRIPSHTTLPTMSDENIFQTLGALKAKMKSAGSKNRVYDLQIEYCYVQRELNIRQARRQAHADWLASQDRNRARRYSR